MSTIVSDLEQIRKQNAVKLDKLANNIAAYRRAGRDNEAEALTRQFHATMGIDKANQKTALQQHTGRCYDPDNTDASGSRCGDRSLAIKRGFPVRNLSNPIGDVETGETFRSTTNPVQS